MRCMVAVHLRGTNTIMQSDCVIGLRTMHCLHSDDNINFPIKYFRASMLHTAPCFHRLVDKDRAMGCQPVPPT